MTALAANRLRGLVDALPAERMELGAVVDALGRAGTGLCLLLFAVLALVPGVAPLFGLALCTVAVGMVLGHAAPLLPSRLRRLMVDRARTQDGIGRVAPWVERLERVLHLRERLPGLVTGTGARLAGAAALLNGVLIVLPIPFGNTAPAVAVLLLALGLVAADGAAVGVALGLTLLAAAIDLTLVFAGYAAVSHLAERLLAWL